MIERRQQSVNALDKDPRWVERSEKPTSRLGDVGIAVATSVNLKLRAGVRRHAGALAVVALIVLMNEGRAYAYTDPGSGLFILQFLTSACVGIFFYFRRLKGWIADWRNRDDSKTDD
ncbi:MAG: hypothetical protein WCC59_17640 [Terriglobales bacterium]